MINVRAAVVLFSLSAAVASAATPPALKLTPFITGLDHPVYVTQAPGDNSHYYIVEDGNDSGTAHIKVFDTATNTTSTFLTVTGLATNLNEQGLLGMTFDPDYQNNKKFYVSYVGAGSGTDPVDGYAIQGVNKIVEYAANSPTAANTTPVGTIIQFNHPDNNHNAGWLGFSPAGTRANDDHNLYISMGDGGGSDDNDVGHVAGGNAQSTQRLLGKILRVHVDPNTATYTIPSNNPFAASSDPTVKKEIFAYGLRNPYRDSFDRATGNLFIGDVGQSTREEVDVQPAANTAGGENYQWRLREGFIQEPVSGGTAPAGSIDPIFDYGHSGANSTTAAGISVIGGYVYRGSAIPGLDGWYLFGDYAGTSSTDPGFGSRAGLYAMHYDGSNDPGLDITDFTNLTAELNVSSGTTSLFAHLSSFGEDNAGELYVTDIDNGRVFKLVGVPEPASLFLIGAGVTLLATRRRHQRV